MRGGYVHVEIRTPEGALVLTADVGLLHREVVQLAARSGWEQEAALSVAGAVLAHELDRAKTVAGECPPSHGQPVGAGDVPAGDEQVSVSHFLSPSGEPGRRAA